jgi:hypothetical protein
LLILNRLIYKSFFGEKLFHNTIIEIYLIVELKLINIFSRNQTSNSRIKLSRIYAMIPTQHKIPPTFALKKQCINKHEKKN